MTTTEPAATVIERVAEHVDLCLGKASIGAPLTVQQRATLAKHLARRVASFGEDALTGQEWQQVEEQVCHPRVPNKRLRFLDLADAISELRDFEDDPRGYADIHGWPLGDQALDSITDTLVGNVDFAVQSLLSVRP